MDLDQTSNYFRKIERESLPVIDDSWFHQVQSRLLVEFYKLQNALGIGDDKGMDEEKLLQVERDIPDWVGNRYLYFNRGLNRLQAEKALLSGKYFPKRGRSDEPP